MNDSTPFNQNRDQTHRHSSQNRGPAICKNDVKCRAYFKGCNCLHRHPPHAQVHIGNTDTNITETENKTPGIVCTNPSNVFFAYCATSTIPTEKIIDHFKIAAEVASDNMLLRIIKALHAVDSNKALVANMIESSEQRATLFPKLLHQFYLEPGISVLMNKTYTN